MGGASRREVSDRAHDLDKVLLRPGDSLHFNDRDDLLATLDRLERPIPARHEGRTKVDREHFVMLRYLRFVASGADLLRLPVTLHKSREHEDPPDFVLEWPDGSRETFELTDGSTEEYQRKLTAASGSRSPNRPKVWPVDPNTSEKEAAQLWAEILFAAFLKKAEALVRGRFDLDHLLLYDLTGLGLLLPLESGALLLRQKLAEWSDHRQPAHRFKRVSVLRDKNLLFDIEAEGQILRAMRSPSFQLPVLRARDEEDLRKRLRDLDRFCRMNSIRHLKAFGSILGDTLTNFRETSDLDLLVEFEPRTRVTLLDMARLERELSELTGFKVDLRTAGDLSRYFRHEVLEKAVELRAS